MKNCVNPNAISFEGQSYSRCFDCKKIDLGCDYDNYITNPDIMCICGRSYYVVSSGNVVFEGQVMKTLDEMIKDEEAKDLGHFIDRQLAGLADSESDSESSGGFPFTPTISIGGKPVELKGYKTKSLRCLGVDPGIANTGIGIVGYNGADYQLLHAECIQTDKEQASPQRYKEIYNRVVDLIMFWDVQLMSVEQVFHNKNVSSSLTTAGVIGIMELLSARKEIPCHVVRPQAVKQAVGCSGNADKKSVTIAVKRLLHTRFETLKSNHAADACATAVAGILAERIAAL